QLHNFAVNSRPHESFPPDFFYYVSKFSRLILDQRRQQNDFRLRLVSKDLIDKLLRRLPAQWLARQRIMRLAYGRKEDPQIIINFGGGRDGRSRIRAGATLLDGDRWRKSLDEIDVWLFHSIEKLPSISRETFDVAALAFGVKRVEGQRRFPRTTQAGNNNQLFPRKFHVKVLEIVLASAAN